MRVRQDRLRDDRELSQHEYSSENPQVQSSLGMDNLQTTIDITYRVSGSSTVLTLSQGS